MSCVNTPFMRTHRTRGSAPAASLRHGVQSHSSLPMRVAPPADIDMALHWSPWRSAPHDGAHRTMELRVQDDLADCCPRLEHAMGGCGIRQGKAVTDGRRQSCTGHRGQGAFL